MKMVQMAPEHVEKYNTIFLYEKCAFFLGIMDEWMI